MYVNNLSKIALDSAAAGIEPAMSSRKSNALTTTPPSHTRHRATGHMVKQSWIATRAGFVRGVRGVRYPQESWLTPQWKLEKHTGWF